MRRARGGLVRLVSFVVGLLALLAVCGCASGERVVELRAWQFVGSSGAPVDVELPARVNRWLPHEPTEYRLRAHVTLDAALRDRRLTLAFPQLHARAALRVDGLEAVPLATEMNDGWRGTNQPRWRIPAEATRDGAIDLELTVPYRHVMSAWIDVAPRLSDTDEGDAPFVAMAWFNRAQAVWCLVAVLVSAFTYAVIFLLDRRRVAYGWFALQGLVGAGGYALLQEGLSQHVFGVYENSFIPLCSCVGAITSVEFTHAQFELGRPSRAWWWALAVGVALAVMFPSPFVGPRIVPAYSCLMITANVSYQVPVAARVWRTRGRSLPALVVLLSWAALGVLGAPDLITWMGLGEIAGGLRGVCVGFFLVAVLQSLVLSVDHHAALSRADELNAELSARVAAVSAKNREVERLNEELRRQIGVRADALAQALAQASAPRVSGPRVLEPGEIVARRYTVVRSVGEGATGRVYEVTRLTDGERLALKLLHSAADAMEMARFAREAQIISQIDHPNVVRIADVDVTHEGFFYLVVEFVEGLSLRHHYARPRTLRWNVDVLAQVAEGLAVVHARGIVHRDLKPANVLVTSAPDDSDRPRVKLADFGISSSGVDGSEPPPAHPSASIPLDPSSHLRFGPHGVPRDGASLTAPSHSSRSTSTSRSDSLLTQTGAWMGTPKYMAPELGGAAKHARPAADVFGFGVMAYELLAGKQPFEDSPAMTRVKGEPFARPAPIAAGVADLEATIAELIDRCLEESPDARPDARAIAGALRGYVTRLDARPS